jgi:hypothetical protein
MIGLGGWGDGMRAGRMVLEDGKIVRDRRPGPAACKRAGRVPDHRTDTQHPITKGLPDKWMHVKDELQPPSRAGQEHDDFGDLDPG